MKTEYQMQIIGRVISLRKEEGKSQAYLAKALDMSPGLLGNVESQKFDHKYALPQLNKIAKMFRVNTESFFKEPGEKRISSGELFDRICRYLEGE